jgi:hypothetical protein
VDAAIFGKVLQMSAKIKLQQWWPASVHWKQANMPQIQAFWYSKGHGTLLLIRDSQQRASCPCCSPRTHVHTY